MGVRSLVKKILPMGLFRRIEPYGHLAEAVIVQTLNGFPAKSLKVIGVTGTDGKTTTCMMIAQMLRNSGCKVAMITTVSVDYADGAGEQPSPTHMTTASVGQLAKMFKKIKANKPDWVVVETSSHALAQHRVWGVPYSVAVLTNITHEHLDYHRTFERYVEAKQQLFVLTNRNKKGLRTGVVNADDPSGELFAGSIQTPVRYGINNGDLRATNIKLTSGGSRFTATINGEEYRIECHIPGRFNVYNSLAAVGAGRAVGLTKEQIERGIASLQRVPGRMMRVEAGQPFEVLIDYAVTPAALENVLKAAQETTTGRVMIVFGATGDRDKTKRPVMGEVVAKYADRIFLTDDETYTENPAAIRQAVLAGVQAAGGEGKCTVIDDRSKAIEMALTEATAGDTIVITGLGHQTDRNMGGKLIPWSDTKIAEAVLRK